MKWCNVTSYFANYFPSFTYVVSYYSIHLILLYSHHTEKWIPGDVSMYRHDLTMVIGQQQLAPWAGSGLHAVSNDVVRIDRIDLFRMLSEFTRLNPLGASPSERRIEKVNCLQNFLRATWCVLFISWKLSLRYWCRNGIATRTGRASWYPHSSVRRCSPSSKILHHLLLPRPRLNFIYLFICRWAQWTTAAASAENSWLPRWDGSPAYRLTTKEMLVDVRSIISTGIQHKREVKLCEDNAKVLLRWSHVWNLWRWPQYVAARSPSCQQPLEMWRHPDHQLLYSCAT
jgi:hypothetical protein